MSKSGIVIAFSGAIGSGRSELSRRVAELLEWPRVSFGDFVRKVALEHKENPNDRVVLQKLGQALVVSDVDSFVGGVLAQDPTWREDGNLVVDGLRHAEVRHALLQKVAPSLLKMVFVKVDEDTRHARIADSNNIEPRLLTRYDQHITEAQIPRILPEYADIDIDNTLPVDIAAAQIIARLGLKSRTMSAAQ